MYVRHAGLEPTIRRALADQTGSTRRPADRQTGRPAAERRGLAAWLHPMHHPSHVQGDQGHGEASPTLGTLRGKPSYVCMDSWTNYFLPTLDKPPPGRRPGRPRPPITPPIILVNADRAVGVSGGFSGGSAASSPAAAIFAAFLGGGVADAEEDWESWVGGSASAAST